MIDERKLAVLRAVITDYVEHSEPVGSKALVERYHLDVSPATIRNDMATLEDEGYLTQPHTSAGRIPTDKGYRLFVDRLATVKPLSPAEKRAISTFLGGAADLDDVVSRTVRLLTQITQQVAIVQYPIVSTAVIRHVDVVRLHHDRALVLLVTSTGRITQVQFDVPPDAPDTDLDAAAHHIAGAVRGLTAAEAVRAVAGPHPTACSWRSLMRSRRCSPPTPRPAWSSEACRTSPGSATTSTRPWSPCSRRWRSRSSCSGCSVTRAAT
jgi:heat-inducible transcriptional repressor